MAAAAQPQTTVGRPWPPRFAAPSASSASSKPSRIEGSHTSVASAAGAVAILSQGLAGRSLRTRLTRARASAARCSQSRTKARRELQRRRLLSASLLGGCSSGVAESDAKAEAPSTVPVSFAVAGDKLQRVPFQQFQERIAAADVVLLGEHHNSVDDHKLEMAVVQALRENSAATGRPLRVGLEMVQQRFQGVLDAYGRGEMGEAELYEATEWAKRWSWPYSLYSPIFKACRESGADLVALNADSETLGKVERGGLELLEPEEWQRYIPDRDGFAALGKVPAFKTYLGNIIIPSYRLHERLGILQQTVTGQVLDAPMTLRHFVGGRLLWDETMAGAAVRALNSEPQAQVCVLIGSDHVKYRYGVRARMERIAKGQAKPLNVVSVLLNPTPEDTLSAPGSNSLTLGMAVPADGGKDQTVVPLADYVLVGNSPAIA